MKNYLEKKISVIWHKADIQQIIADVGRLNLEPYFL